ncbi:RagB/SusD family nutrient uptake outer membrane protein [Arcicella aquatica]|uniref:RagB/SusD family nutrient uptake outer membrane protein n=1 Tax=Arcicella aquatica TaxID=217141 RepID=A0ABU5QM35_9BACT|nr:RagB/SusD family nutrient uptake outer membrane protein [Arcicella aquatica]MEA5257845.1 RagB/SusD family nutrient uptake outer membrane protein [Arcicella aquatica]
MIKKLIVLLVMATALTSCSDDFVLQTDPNSVAASDYFRTENDVLLAVNGVYQSLRSSNNIGENSGLYTDERSDDAGRNDNQSNAGEPFQFNDFSILPSNTYLKSHWLSLYQTIARCNQVTSNIDNVTFTTVANKDIYNAEVKFVRAMIYFHLVRKWGDVPLVTKQLNSDEIVANTFREKKEKVYEQIVADLKEAVASGLPNQQPLTGKGRVSKAAANALLGQVYLTMATTLDQANRASNLANAKTYLTAAYNMKTFTTLKDIPYVDVFDINKKSTNPEIIFQIVNKQGDITYSSSIAANNQAKGETINSLKPSSGVGGNVKLDLVKEYETNDLRKDFSIKYANDASVKDWYITKFRDASALAGATGLGGNDWPIIRYADVILMLAEVSMYLGEEANAIQYLNQVRERAKMPTYEVMKNDADYAKRYPTLKLAILHERRVELAFEHHRWFDLLRFFTATELVSYIQSKAQADYGTAKVSNFGLKDYLFPIPADEYKLNPVKMYQNTGY